MNKIVQMHVPVDVLPVEMQEQLVGVGHVTLEATPEDAEASEAPLTHEEAIALMRQMQREAAAEGRTVTSEEAVRRIRELRDEWDD